MPPTPPPSVAVPEFEAWTAAPGSVLRRYVTAYVQQAVVVPAGREVVLTQSASIEPVACVKWSGEVQIGGRAPAPPVSLVGPMATPLTTRFGGDAQAFFVRFAPTGLRALLGVRGRDYRADASFERSVAVLPSVRTWAGDVARAGDFEERVVLTERWLAGELARRAGTPSGDGTAFAEAAVAHIGRASGVLRVDALADALGVSPSTLRRRFVAELGLAPKTYCEIVRLRGAHAFLLAHADATWADAVVRFGYSDQAHLVHAYARYVGVSPTRWTPDTRAMDVAFGMGAELASLGDPSGGARFVQEPARAGTQLVG